MSRKEAVIRETKRRTLSLLHNAGYRTGSYRLKAILDNYDPLACTQIRPEKIKTVTFLITRMVRFHGGQTSILHLGTELEKLGIRVCYLSCKEQSSEEMEFCAGANLPDYRGRVYLLNRYMAAIQRGKIKTPDVVVASSWDTVFFAKRFTGSYKAYFVQDYEPYFYPFGEEYLMCRNTYLQGLHMISLGSWNREMIEKESGEVKIDTVSFPYDSLGYTHFERDYESYPEKKKITIAVYLKFYGKRLPNLIPYMLVNTREKLKSRGIELEVLYFGEAKTFSPKGGKNLGQLNRDEMAALYKRADFGMVASMSNISLVPYEMHAAGLPVIEFKDGSYPYFFGLETALLTGIGEKDISDLLISAIKNPYRLKCMDENAGNVLKDLSWERTGKEFLEILKQTVSE
ncbi:MAG: glycosyltransferase family 4 protein [Lachnospiraceae bacterium]|nr:glycosyltransferase family 4 protein [Lachnospiraceae bacterium]